MQPFKIYSAIKPCRLLCNSSSVMPKERADMTIGELKKCLEELDDDLPVIVRTSSFSKDNMFAFTSDIGYSGYAMVPRFNKLDPEDMKKAFVITCEFH